MRKLTCPRGGATRLTFAATGDLLAATGRTAVYCWARDHEWALTGLEHDGPVTGVAFHPGGRTLAYSAIASGAPRELSAHPPGAPAASVWRRRFARESLRPFTGVHLYSLTGTDEFVPNRVRVPRDELSLLTPDNFARGLTFTPDGRALLAGHHELAGLTASRAAVYHWHFTERAGVWYATDPVAARGATAGGGALMDGFLVLAGYWGVAALAVAPVEGLFVPDVQATPVVAVAPGRELVATYAHGPIEVWSLRAPDRVARITDAPALVTALAFDQDGRALAAGHAGGEVSFWNPDTGGAGPRRDFGVGPVTALAYAPDGLTLAVAGSAGVVVVDTD
jgi:WD40 repeat protein